MNRYPDLQQKTAIITGAAMGLGKAIATAYVQAGVTVALLDFAAQELSAVAAKLRNDGGKVFTYAVDLRDANATADAAKSAISDMGSLDILVSNAGILVTKPFEQHGLEDWDNVLSTNLRPAFVISKNVYPHFKEHGGGVILFVSSASGIKGFLDETAYCAAKHGLEGFMKCLAMEGKEHNIRVNTITPGHGMHTPLSEVHYTEEQKKVWVEPMALTPAFLELATTAISGERLNAWEISERIRATIQDDSL
jgi:NAD(P)-dependent dehydrogenase (short-subunit alcohol dehydrogenase family)